MCLMRRVNNNNELLLLLLSIFLRLQRTSVLHGSVTGGLTAPLQKTEDTGMNLPSPCGF